MSSAVTDYGVSGVAPGEAAPLPDAVVANGVGVSVQIPMRADETWEEGDIEAQTTVCLNNRVMHVTVYLTDMADWAGMNAVWQSVFHDRSPSRAAIGTTALSHPSMRVETVALLAQG